MLRNAVFLFVSASIALTLIVGILGCGNTGGVAPPVAAAPLSPPPPPDAANEPAPVSEALQNPSDDKADGESQSVAIEQSGGGTDSPSRESPQPTTEPVTENSVEQEAQPAAAPAGEENDASKKVQDAPNAVAAPPGPKLENPFPRRFPVPEFSKQITWLNTKPLTKTDLKGKFVLLDFWTYCCINCMHILPELKKLEREFPNNLVVIGVHSAKFDTERGTDNIRDAILRYEIEHPVINDADHSLWNAWGVSSWPTIILLDPEGMGVWGRPGEFKADEVKEKLTTAIPY